MTYVKRLKRGTLTDITTSNQFNNVADHSAGLSDRFQNDTGLWTFGYLEFTDLATNTDADFQFKFSIVPVVDGTNDSDHNGGIIDVDREVEIGRVHGGDGVVGRIAMPVPWLPPCEFYFRMVNESGNASGSVECNFLPCTYEVVQE